MAWTWDIIAPVVGGKITAAGFGAQVDGAVAELQSVIDTITGGTASAGATTWATQRDGILLGNWGKPGLAVAGMTGAATSVAAGPTTVVSGPSSGRRIVKNIAINVPTLNTTVTATLAGTTLFTINFAAAGFLQIPVAIPIANTETLQITTDHTVTVTSSYADRSDATVTRLGYVKSTGSGTLRASGTAATITQLWLCNSDNSAGNIQLTIGQDVINQSMPARSVLTIDDPIAIPASTAVTYTSGGTNVTMLAAGF